MHSLWNFFTKKSVVNKISVLWLGWTIAGVLTFPFALHYADFTNLDFSWLVCIALTAVIHAVYIYLVGWSYSLGEMSLIYPIARGIAIFLTVLIVLLFGIDVVSNFGLLGICIVALGIFLIAMKRINDLEKRLAIIAACAVGSCTACYSLLDKFCIEFIPPFFYISSMFLFSALLLAPLMYLKLWPQTVLVFNKHKFYAGAIGLVTMLTYFLILLAMKMTSVAYVVALREISIVFGSLLGICLLKEERNKRKIIGIITIFLGALIIKLA
jgi:drug/metabolite transporter (DMT)-like permease